MGTPNLYELHLSLEVNGEVSDVSHTKFGIREITSEVAEQAPDRLKRLFKINGKNILIRGGGWTPDMMLRETPERLADEFRYVRDMGLNTVRLEGKIETEEFFEMADQQGILVMAGWCCCDFWEHWGSWKDEDFEIAKASLRDQMYRLRSHPSLVMWLNGSDNPPPPDVEEMYLKIEADLRWPNPVVSSATAKPTTVTGESGVKMSGPYEYVAPSYWTADPHLHGGRKTLQPGRMRRRLWLQHRNQHGAGGSADRERRAHGSRKIIFGRWMGRWMNTGISTRAAAPSRRCKCLPTR